MPYLKRCFYVLLGTIALLIGWSHCSYAQIIPPEIICIDSDTIFWNTPTNNCGVANGYLVWGSMNEAGPYNLLTTVPVGSTSFFHNDADGQIWYYYLQTDADCPSEPMLNSDTLSNRIPPEVPIDFVTVVNNQAEVHWTAIPDSQIEAYVIYRVTSTGTSPIDTLYSATVYTDTEALPNQGTEIYYVVGLDACENTGLFNAPHFTTHLVLGTESCTQSIDLFWTPYQNWTEGIAQQEVWVSTNFGTPQLAATLSGTASTYQYTDITDGDSYCFYINAIENNTGFVSRSNETCTTADIIQPNTNLFITNVSINTDQSVQVDWYWNNNAELVSAQLERSIQDATPDLLPLTIDTPLFSLNTYNDTTPVGDPTVSYSITTEDACGNIQTSEAVRTIYLQINTSADRSNQLTWTALNIPNATVLSYAVFCVENGNPTFLENTGANTTEYTHGIDINNIAEAAKCYYVEAQAEVPLPDGTIETITARSNTVCAIQEATIYAPNAFTPNGRNPIFKPAVAFEETIQSYQMLIYDRWGKLLFESDQTNIGWDGRSQDGTDMPVGAYTYFIRVEQASGDYTEAKGVLMLLR